LCLWTRQPRSGGSRMMSQVENLVASLKETIDRLDSTFTKAKDQVLELARVLDESKQCERSHISRKIKELLDDKIKEGKITSKWIHDCLASEYKREYTKREVTSLSSETGNAEDVTELSSQSGRTTLVEKVSENSNNNNSLSDEPAKSSSEEQEQFVEIELPQKQLHGTAGNNIYRKLSSVSSEIQKQASAFVVFEFFMPLEELRRYLEPIYRETAGRGNAWFHGILDVRTGRVTDVSTGRAVNNISQENGEGTL